eukprot:7207474-Alexandrium_andersonii.AAC.1
MAVFLLRCLLSIPAAAAAREPPNEAVAAQRPSAALAAELRPGAWGDYLEMLGRRERLIADLRNACPY